MVTEIPLFSRKYPGYVALVDDEDVELLRGYPWTVQVSKRGDTVRVYAISYFWDGTKQTRTYMHRLISGVDEDHLADHKDRNTLNNTRDNLRPCTHTQNMQNRCAAKSSKSGYRGVYWHSGDGLWRAEISANKTRKHLGGFQTAEEAAQAWNEAAIELHGEFARLNDLSQAA